MNTPGAASLRHGLLLFFALAASALAVESREISAELEVIRTKYKVPACAAAVIEGGRITAIGASGFRRADRDVRVTTADVWHIGSCTKSMTAVLIGVLVDAGKLRWDTSIPDALSDVNCHAAWRKVTIWHLVTQRSGVGTMSRDQMFSLDTGGGTSRDQRTNFARMLLSRAPAEAPGRFAYSNSGYGLLGAIIERASGESYEDFLRARFLRPLGLKTAGFGAPATLGLLDQPWGITAETSAFCPWSLCRLINFHRRLRPPGASTCRSRILHASLGGFRPANQAS